MAFVRLNKRCVMLCYLEVGRSKVKVTRPIDAETEMRHIFRRGRTTNFKLGRGMEYETRISTCAVTSKSNVKVTTSRRESDAFCP